MSKGEVETIAAESSAAAAFVPTDDTPLIGRTWLSNFTVEEEDKALFEVPEGYARVEDANGVKVLRSENPAAPLKLLTKAQDVKDVEVMVRYFPRSSGAEASSNFYLYARHISDANCWRLDKRFNGAVPTEKVESRRNGDNQSGQRNGIATLGYPRWAKIRIEGDLAYSKSWAAWTNWKGPWSAATAYKAGDGVQEAGGSSYVCMADFTGGSKPSENPGTWVEVREPQWQLVRELRGPNGMASNFSATLDNIEAGSVGCGFKWLNCDLYEISVTELLRRPGNMLRNSTFRDTETTDLVPVNWNKEVGAGNTCDVEIVTLPEDLIRTSREESRKVRALHLKKTEAGKANACSWHQLLYNAFQTGKTNGGGRQRLHPMVPMPRMIRVTGLSKGKDIVRTNPVSTTFGAMLDVYEYSREVQAIMTYGTGGAKGPVNNYFFGLDPAGPVSNGDGTWDWHPFEFYLNLEHVHPYLWALDVQWLFHDSCVGEYWIAYPRFEPAGAPVE